VVGDLASISLDSGQAVSISSGQAVMMSAPELDQDGETRLLKLYSGNRFLGVGEWNKGVVRPRRLMRTDA